MSLKGKTDAFGRTDIFAGRNNLTLDPATIKMLSDRVLIRDDGDAEKEGSIIIPEMYRESATGKYRSGVVVAVGPGDRFHEIGIIESADGCSPQVRRKLITMPCENCSDGSIFDIREYELVLCQSCHGSKRMPVCVPPQCKPGDRVLYEKRREAEVWLNGQRHVMVHAEQAVVAVLED